jgi:hypothetical protein
MQGAVSIEITEIIWICNVMGFFFKFGKQIEENSGRFGALKSDSTHHFFRNACTKSLRFSQFSSC